MEQLVSLILISLYGNSNGTDIHENRFVKDETWLRRENDERRIDREQLKNGETVIKITGNQVVYKRIGKLFHNYVRLHFQVLETLWKKLSAWLIVSTKTLKNI